MKLSQFKTNKELEVTGVWHDLGDKTRVLIARSGNAKYKEELRRRLKKYQNRLDRKDDTLEPILEKIFTELVAEYILLKWENLFDENDIEVPYSFEKCKEILGNPEYSDFRKLIEALSEDMSSYQEKKKEDVLKN